MDLQEKLDNFQKTVFTNFRGASNNECKISSLVPLIEESFNLYKFLTSLFTLFADVVERDIFESFEIRYRTLFRNLKKFYHECSNIRYLTSLIQIPTLPNVDHCA
jgi:hypothetical protein